jgi:inhibitor of KinA
MTDTEHVRIFPLGDSALTVEFGNVISENLNVKAIALARSFADDPFEGFIEAVPAYASTTIFYDVVATRTHCAISQTAYAFVETLVREKLAVLDMGSIKDQGREIEIEVRFGSDAGPDLSLVAEFAGISEADVIQVFTSKSYRVYMLGFLPGFSYLGEVDERIAMPRKDSPRKVVRKGSVGIASTQTGIYSLESPGGWQIIGRSDVELFTPAQDPPTYLKAGDMVRFVSKQ